MTRFVVNSWTILAIAVAAGAPAACASSPERSEVDSPGEGRAGVVDHLLPEESRHARSLAARQEMALNQYARLFVRRAPVQAPLTRRSRPAWARDAIYVDRLGNALRTLLAPPPILRESRFAVRARLRAELDRLVDLERTHRERTGGYALSEALGFAAGRGISIDVVHADAEGFAAIARAWTTSGAGWRPAGECAVWLGEPPPADPTSRWEDVVREGEIACRG